MKKLFFSLLITLGAIYTPNAMAQGTLRPGGKTLTEQGRTADLQSYLKNICGANSTGTNATINGTPNNSVGDVYFVGINHYWVGSLQNNSYNSYDQINKGVDKIEKVKDESKQTTSSGTFYTYEAKNANKFFFIVRRASKKTKDYNLAFKWYDEWSYVENTSGGYGQLTPCYDQLKDGAPFFAPHNCDTSLDTNHYITLNDKEDDTPEGIKGYNFTAFLYVPTGASNQSSFESTGTGEYKYVKSQTVYVYKKGNSPITGFWGSAEKISYANSNWYVKNADGTFSQFRSEASDNYYSYTTSPDSRYDYQTVEIYTRSEVKAYKNAPYVFFYTVGLQGNRSAKKAISSEFDCPYDAELNWSTAFDKYKTQVPNTKYDGMKEHYILERSYDKIDWETVEGINDVNGNSVSESTGKKFTDTGLKDFDETTKKIGYTVYYRLTSVVQKADGTEMARRMAPEIVTIMIPGSSPFSITLEEGDMSEYVHGTMGVNGYVDGKNIFTHTLICAETAEHETVNLTAGAKLELIRTDNENPEGAAIAEFTVTDAPMTLAALANKIGVEGRVDERFETAPGESKDAQYQLRLTVGSDVILSNLVDIVGSKVANTTAIMHRSGTPDAATCADVELFCNEIKFKPANTGVGTYYRIYNNGELVMTLTDNGNLTFSDENGVVYKEDAAGMLTITHKCESKPIAVGETQEEATGVNFHYAVAHYDKNTGKSYGSAAKAAAYEGSLTELVVNLAQPNKGETHVGYSYNYAFIRPILNWSHIKAAYDDVKSPIRYEIYRKVELADFEKTLAPENASSVLMSASTTGTDGKNITNGTLDEYVKIGEVAPEVTTYNDDFYYARRPQSSGNWVNPLSADELRPTSYYIKAIFSEDETVAKNVREKNSGAVKLNLAEGSIFTAIDDVQAEGVLVVAANGVITVTGVVGTITVYDANGQVAAVAEGDGTTTEIDASSLNGVYVVKANNMQPTKILIK